MKETDDRLYLIHIIECIDRIDAYVAEGKATFLQDTKTQDAVLRNLQTLAESTKRLSASLKDAHPDADWPEIARFQNVMVHDYMSIDLLRVWDIVQHDLPDLKRKVQAILEGLPEKT